MRRILTGTVLIAAVLAGCVGRQASQPPTATSVPPSEVPATPAEAIDAQTVPEIEHLATIDGGDKPFDAPYGVDVNAGGQVYVLDTNNQQVRVFDQAGEELFGWGEPGDQPGQFDTLGFGSLALDTQGNVFVVDNGNFRVQKFDPNGNFLLQFGQQGEGEGSFTRAIGIATDDLGNVYVTDDAVPFVQVFDEDGNFLRQFGGEGEGPGQLLHATGLGLDPQGHIYVADYEAKRVQAFSNQGEFMFGWVTGEDSPFPGTPEGITVDPLGRIYVTDYGLGKVEVFTPGGKFLASFGQEQLDSPVDISLSSDGLIFVTDQATDLIQIFSLQ